MKKLFIFAIVAFMCISMTACGGKSASQSDKTAGDRPKYIFYSDNAFEPFEYRSEKSGKYVGLDMDIIKAVAEDQNFDYVMKNEGFKAAMYAVHSGQADAMIAGMTISDEEKENFDFSDGYFADGQIIVVPRKSGIKSENDLKGRSIAVKEGTMGLEYAQSIKDKYGFTISCYEDSASMYQAVIDGTNDACFEDFSIAGWAIKSEGIALKTAGEIINPTQFGFAVKKGENAELIELFNNGLKNIKSNGTYKKILAKYGYLVK